MALRALASVAKTEEVRDQLIRIAEMYDQLANYLKGPEAPLPDARQSERYLTPDNPSTGRPSS